MSVVFLDFETSGFNPYHDDIIEIATKEMNSDNYFSTLVKPKSNECISQRITAVTSITNKLLRDEGFPWQKAYSELNDFLKSILQKSPDGKLYIIAHNGETFDFLFLKRIFSDLNELNIKTIPSKNIVYIDSLLFARRLLKRESYKQETLCKTFNINTKGNHRALNDVRALEELFITIGSILNKQLNSRRNILENPQMIYDYIHFKK
jgi:DNA polymerase III alpha subunit (gram-positive type)